MITIERTEDMGEDGRRWVMSDGGTITLCRLTIEAVRDPDAEALDRYRWRNLGRRFEDEPEAAA